MLTKQKYLNDVELNSLLATLSRFESSDFRNVTLLRVLLETGARASEVLGIRACDLDPHDETVFIRALKKGVDRDYPLPPSLFAALLKLSLGRAADALVFGIGYHRAREIWVLYRPCLKCMHSLRHTKAIVTYRKTRDPRLVQQVMGHKTMSATEVYTNLVRTADELRRAMS